MKLHSSGHRDRGQYLFWFPESFLDDGIQKGHAKQMEVHSLLVNVGITSWILGND